MPSDPPTPPPQKTKITKEVVQEMIDAIKALEGKELDQGVLHDLKPDAVAWYVAYGTS